VRSGIRPRALGPTGGISLLGERDRRQRRVPRETHGRGDLEEECADIVHVVPLGDDGKRALFDVVWAERHERRSFRAGDPSAPSSWIATPQGNEHASW